MAIETVISELNELRSAGVIGDYAIGGAFAAHAYIAPMATEDVDVFVFLAGAGGNPLAPLSGIYANLIGRGAKEDGAYLVIGGWPVQVLTPVNPLYDDAILNARSVSFGTELGRVMGPEHLAAIALDTGRPKDKLRLIEFINTGVLDSAKFEALIKSFGLADKWNSFQSTFLTRT